MEAIFMMTLDKLRDPSDGYIEFQVPLPGDTVFFDGHTWEVIEATPLAFDPPMPGDEMRLQVEVKGFRP